MLKIVLAGTTALAIAGGSFAYAQPGTGQPDQAQRWRPSAEDVAAMGDARVAALKAGLKLTAEQEKNWPAVESALRNLAKQRADRVAARADNDRPADPMERLARRAERMESRGAALKKFADAAGPLYNSLDAGQKRRFVKLANVGGRNDMHGRHGLHHRHGQHHGQPGGERGQQRSGGGEKL